MAHPFDLSLLTSWQNFYMMVGTAAATLTGLMFIAMSLVAGSGRNPSTLDAGIDAFHTPIVVHFGAVLLAAGILSAPWQAVSSLQHVLGLLALSLVIYMVIVLLRMRRIPEFQTPWKDWLWYMVFPLAAYIVLFAATVALPANPGLMLYIIAAAMVVVLFIGLRNAWDLVSFFATRPPGRRAQ